MFDILSLLNSVFTNISGVLIMYILLLPNLIGPPKYVDAIKS